MGFVWTVIILLVVLFAIRALGKFFDGIKQEQQALLKQKAARARGGLEPTDT